MTIWIPEITHWSGPRYLTIAEAIEKAIRAKELQPGQRLPTHREMAYQLNVSVQTVSRAYAEAERRRLVSGEIGRGTFVRMPRSDVASGFIADSGEADVLDFSNIAPLITPEHLAAIAGTIKGLSGDEELSRLFAFRPTGGIDVHRQAGADWLDRNGVAVAAENIIITNHCAHGVWVAMASLAEPGDVVATEELVDYTITTNASILRLQHHGLAMDDQGILPEAFEDLCKQKSVKLLCITPCYSNPTVSLMPESRRRELAELARRFDVAIVEADEYGPYLPDRPRPLWCFAPERTYYATSLSVTGLLSGYLVGPPAMIPRMTTRFRATGWIANTWAAEVASRWIYDGTAETLTALQRSRLKARHGAFEKAMRGNTYVSHPHAPHVWLTLPEPWRAGVFVQEARRRNILLTPPDPFIVGRSIEPHAVRLAFGDTVRDEQDFERGIRQIAELIDADPDLLAEHF